MLKAIIEAIIGALLGFFGQRVDQSRQRQNDRQAGADEAARQTDQSTKAIADDRAKIAAAPDDPDSVAERLRAKANRAEGRGPNQGG